jgi:hypothetical protein
LYLLNFSDSNMNDNAIKKNTNTTIYCVILFTFLN